MRHIIVFMTVLAGCWNSPGHLMAQSSEVFLDFLQLDNRQVRLHGPGGIDDTLSTKTAFLSRVLNHNSTYTLEINPDQLVATVEFDLDGSGLISAVRWKDADGSQTGGGFQALGSSYYTLGSPADKLTLHPAYMDFDYQNTSLNTVYCSQIWSTQLHGGYHSLALFPGDYEFVPGDPLNNVAVCRLAGEVQAAGADWGPDIQWQQFRPVAGESLSWSSLDTTFFELNNGNQLLLQGKTIYLDKQIDNKEVYFFGLQQGLGNSGNLDLIPGNLDFSIGLGEGLSAFVGTSLDPGSGQLGSTVVWLDPDSSQVSAPTELASGYVTGIGDTIRLEGVQVWLDVLGSNNGVSTAALNSLNEGYNLVELFPGDYKVRVNQTSTLLDFEVLTSGKLSDKVHYQDTYDPNIPQEELHSFYYTSTADSLQLHGREFQIDLSNFSQHALSLIQLPPGGNNAVTEQSVTLKLLPAGYMGDITPDGDSEPKYRCFFRLQNRNAGFQNPVYWNDLSLTGDPYSPDTTYPGYSIWLRHRAISWFRLPDQIVTAHADQYAKVSRKIDGEWLEIPDRTLRFQYTGEYDQGALSFRLMNWKREDINVSQSLNLSLNKVHGDNRYDLVLPGSVASGHYLLEVTNEKNETFFLRFAIQ